MNDNIGLYARALCAGRRFCVLAVAAGLWLGHTSAIGQQYTVTNLNATLGGTNSEAWGVNASGQVTGLSETSGNATLDAFLLSGGAMQNLGSLGGTVAAGEGYTSFGNGLNDSGQVTGFAEIAGNSAYHAFLNSNGAMRDLGTLGGTDSEGVSVNDSGQVTGFANTANNAATHGFIYSNGAMVDIGTLGGTLSEGMGINASGQVTGLSWTSSNAEHAFLYSHGAMQDLGTLGGSWSWGWTINASAQVTGWSLNSAGQEHAFLYSNGTMQDLGALGGSGLSRGYGINASGEVVGESGDAFLYRARQMLDLNAIDNASATYTLYEATGINNNGFIVANGIVNATGAYSMFLLSPWQGSGVVNINASVSGYSAGTVTAPVELSLGVGCYAVADGFGHSGAIYDAFNYHLGVADDWAWQYRIVNATTGATLLYGAASSDEFPATHYATEVAAARAGEVLGTLNFCLSAATTVGFVIDDNYLSDNTGGISLLVTQYE